MASLLLSQITTTTADEVLQVLNYDLARPYTFFGLPLARS